MIADTVPKMVEYAYSTTGTPAHVASRAFGRQEGNILEVGMNLDLEGGNRICMVLEWTLGLKRL